MEDSSPNATLADVERAHILATLALYGGNRTRAAQALGISVRCLRNKLHVYTEGGFEVPEPGIAPVDVELGKEALPALSH
jgi:DNA-binding NtrC family response regulator